MKLPDLLQEHAQPLEILYNTRWLNTLLQESRSCRALEARSPKNELKMNTSALQAVRSGSLRTLVAVLPSQHEAAERLVRKRYAWRGYNLPPTGNADELEAQDHEPTRVTLLTEDEGNLLGTLTVRLDSPEGLLAEETYGPEVDRLRRQGRRVAEITRLAVEEGVDWKSALDALVQSAYLVTRIIHSLNDVFIEVNPRHVRFYQRALGFVVAAPEGTCSRVGAPSVLMLLDLEKFGQRVQRYAA
jgi:hypothetical protein